MLLTASCSHPNAPEDRAGITRSLRGAARLVRPHDPAAATAIEAGIRDAEAATAAEASKPFWRRRAGRSESAWLRVARLAARAVAEVRSAQIASDARWSLAAATAEQAVASARERMATPGMGRAEARALSQAETRLGQAHRLAAAGELDRATAAAEEATAFAAAPEAHWKAMHARFSDPSLIRAWRHQAEETIRDSRRTGRAAIVIDKLNRTLRLYRAGHLVHLFPAELGTNGLNPKRYAGDQATPEGRYRVAQKKRGRQTVFHSALLLDYPNPEDLARFRSGRRNGTIPRGVGVGGLIEIHGEGGSGRDWTDGCVALTNADMDVLFASVQVGTPVTIVGALEP